LEIRAEGASQVQTAKNRFPVILVVLLVLIGVMVVTRIPSRPPDSELVSTADWCPYFVRDLQAQSKAGTLGTFGVRSEPIFWDDYVIIKRAAQVLNIELRSREIQSLKGIEYFPRLEGLTLDSKRLTQLDLSHNVALESAQVFAPLLTAINISNSVLLLRLDLMNTALMELDVSNNERLGMLFVGTSQLTALNVSHNTNLRWLEVSRSQLTGLDVSRNKMLRWLDVSYNNMRSPSDVVGWEDIGLRLRREPGDAEMNFVFHPQNPSAR